MSNPQDTKKLHRWVPFPEHIAQNVDSLRSAIHTRDSLQSASDKAIDDSVAAKQSKASRLKKFLKGNYLLDKSKKTH